MGVAFDEGPGSVHRHSQRAVLYLGATAQFQNHRPAEAAVPGRRRPGPEHRYQERELIGNFYRPGGR